MKKKYVKPGLYIENFALSQSIATDCNIDKDNPGSLGFPTQADPYSCGWSDGLDIVWMDPKNNCTQIVDENFVIDGNCYNNPTGSTAIFNYS